MIPGDFHFLRPEWLWLIVPTALLLVLALRQLKQSRTSSWTGLVDAHLLRHLAVPGEASGQNRWHLAALAAGLLAAILAMAGPTWQKIPVPTYRGDMPTVLVLSLAQSMNGTDLVPSRLTRAEHKLRDMLERAKGDDVALIVYADQPFVASPLTGDSAVIRQMLPELSTDLMPVLGNRLDLAISKAQELLKNSDARQGRIIVLADDTGLGSGQSQRAAKAAHAAGYVVSILGVGTAKGAQLQTGDGRAIRTKDGADVTAHLDVDGLRALATAGGGVFTQVTADSGDIGRLMPKPAGDVSGAGRASDLKSDSWNDMGYLLVLIPVLLAPFAFRRGVLFVLAMILFGAGFAPRGAVASPWDDLWQTPDQQAQEAFDAGDYATAAQEFTANDARGAAEYRAGDYAAASKLFGNDAYNRGNALAQAGELEAALKAYDQALEAAPEDVDARFNRDLVAKLLEQQKQDEKQQKQDQQQQQQDQQQEQDQQQGQQQQSEQQQGQQGQKQQQKPGQQGEKSGKADQNSAENAQGQQGEDKSESADSAQGNDATDQSGQQSRPEAGEQASKAPQQSSEGKNAGQKTAEGQEPNRGAAGHQQAADEAPQPTPEGNAGAAAGQEDTESGFSKLMDDILGGNGEADEQGREPTESAAGTPTPRLDQAAEQQLRAVPDDPSGLLRARIRQHYARMRAASQ